MTQIEALQNAAKNLGLNIHQKQFEDKRKAPKYFAQLGSKSVSPVLDYDNMNHFLLGWSKSKEN
jgi:hypothetical protein